MLIKENQSFKSFSQAEMQNRPDQVREWAQSDNPLLAALAKEVIEAAEG